MFEMFNSIHKSFKMLFPTSLAEENNEHDSTLESIEINRPRKKLKTSDMNCIPKPQVKDIKEALKSRCPSTWTDKVKILINK